MSGGSLRGYYAILDLGEGEGRARDGGALERRAGELLAARPCCLQLRAKALSTADLHAAALRVLPAARAAVVPFCINDRLDVALAVGADAVHLGQDDLPLDDARRIAARAGTEGFFIGISTHDFGQAQAAVAGGADYIGFGPVFETKSKIKPDPVVGLDELRRVAAAVRVPV